MNFLSRMRITHKISALMVGLTLGFVAIGVTYYVRVNVSEQARDAEIDAFIFQQRLSELRELELNLLFRANQMDRRDVDLSIESLQEFEQSFAEKLESILKLESSLPYQRQLKEFQLAMQDYNSSLADKVESVAALNEKSITDTRNELQSAFINIENRLASTASEQTKQLFAELKQSIEAYFNASSETSRNDVQEKTSNFNQQVATDEALQLSDEQRLELQQAVEILSSRALSLTDELYRINDLLTQKQERLESIINDLTAASDGLFESAVERTAEISQVTQATVTAIIFFVAMLTAIGIYLIYKSIVFPLVHMQNVIGRINRGNTKARVKILSEDELGDLGLAFNRLLDERIQQLEAQSKENEELNNSIIALIQALGAIAMKDLTIKVPVSADITGTISDAVNLLTGETAHALKDVKDISNSVNQAAGILQKQSQLVMQFAESEKMQIIATSKALKVLAAAMTDVASRSETADQSAMLAIDNTQKAKNAVVETVTGIRAIRETISETEKRTKRLGDRSQEISGIVNLINTIAERTHILALNASMHAASAGEAGKGFAVVAEEVQRLAENARQSTDEIAAMVNNMRVETADTVNIMNKLISQVAEGSKLAEQAGTQMETTAQATRELGATVKQIAVQAVQQAAVANRINDRTSIIRNFSDKTDKQLKEQKVYTDNLSAYAASLIKTVNVFKLPQDEEQTQVIDISDENNKVSPIKSAV